MPLFHIYEQVPALFDTLLSITEQFGSSSGRTRFLLCRLVISFSSAAAHQFFAHALFLLRLLIEKFHVNSSPANQQVLLALVGKEDAMLDRQDPKRQKRQRLPRPSVAQWLHDFLGDVAREPDDRTGLSEAMLAELLHGSSATPVVGQAPWRVCQALPSLTHSLLWAVALKKMDAGTVIEKIVHMARYCSSPLRFTLT